MRKEGDDLMSATRYAVVMLRYARNLLPVKPRSTVPAIPRGGWMVA